MSLSLSATSSFSSLITLILTRLASSHLFLPFFSPSPSTSLSHLPSLHWLPSFSLQTGLVLLVLTFLPLVFSPCLSASLSHLPSLHWLLSFSPVWPHPACSYLSSSSLLYTPLSLSIKSSVSSLLTLIFPRLASTPLLTFLPLVSPPCLSASLSHLPSLHWLLSFYPDWPHPACSYLSPSSLLSMSLSLSITSSFSSLITLFLSRLASSRLPFFSPCLSASLSHLPSLHWLPSFYPDWPHPVSSYFSSSSLLYMSLSLTTTSSFSSLITLIPSRLASSCLCSYLSSSGLLSMSLSLSITSSFSSLITHILPRLASSRLF